MKCRAIYGEPTVKGRKPGLKSMIFFLLLKEEKNIHLEQNEKTRIKINEEKLRNLWDNFKHSNI